MNVITTRRHLNPNQKSWIIKRITLNNSYTEIKKEFQIKFGRSLNIMTISRLKNKHIDVVTAGKNKIIENAAIESAAIKQQSYRLLARKMDRAEEDMTELDKLRRLFQTGQIDSKEYKRRRTLYEDLTVSELTNVANAAHSHMKGIEDEAARPEDAAALKMLVASIQSGNPVNLIQMLNPTINTAKSPEASQASQPPA